jgi:hypothetical protein
MGFRELIRTTLKPPKSSVRIRVSRMPEVVRLPRRDGLASAKVTPLRILVNETDGQTVADARGTR